MINSFDSQSDSMKTNEYKKLIRQLNTPLDIDKLASRTKYDKDLLLVLYSQKTVKNATKKYHKIKHLARKYHSQWKSGKSFLQIAEKIEFPPVLTGLLILKEEGISRKMYRKYLNNLDEVKNKRLRKELQEVIDNDIIYSPEGNNIQAQRGLKGEERINKWLTKKKLQFQTETELAENHEKTPDFLLRKPINVRGIPVYWIESKATFGCKTEIKKNLKNQLIPYRELFGSGMVIYWYGFITPPPILDGIIIESDKFFLEWSE
jgi:hypothetical protein